EAPPPAQPGLSPAQIQQLIQSLTAGGNQDPAAAAQLMRTLIASQAAASAAPQAAAAAPSAAPVTPAALPVTLRQASQAKQVAPHTRESVFVKTKSNDMADALKAQAMTQALNLGAVAAARKVAGSVPYVAGMSSVLHHVPFGGGGKQQGWEFD